MSDELLKLIINKLESMDEKVGQMDVKLDRIEQKLDATFEQTAKSVETISEITATLERQERILDILSTRSIEQEADIKKLKNR